MIRAQLHTGFAALSAAAMTLLCATASATPAGAPAAVVVASAPPQVGITGQGVRTLSSAEFAEVRGEYLLAGGGSMVVGGARHRPIVEFNDKAPMALLAVAPNQLVSADGQLRLEFRTEANGEVSAVTVHVAPGLL